MKLSGLLQRTRPELPGVAGTARVDRRTDALVRRVKAGEVAVLDQVDLDRTTADALVAAGVVGVVNASPSISGRFPNLGPEILIDAGIALVDDVGAEALHKIKDGSRIRLHEGVVYAGEFELARGFAQDVESVADALVEAKAGLTHQLEAFAANTTEFMRQERALLLDGVGIPAVDVELAGRQVVVVAAGFDHAAELARLKAFIREYRPVLVGVEREPTRCARRVTPPRSSSATRPRSRTRRSPAGPTSSCPRSTTGTPPACTACRTSGPAPSRSPAWPTPRTWRCCWWPTTARP